MDPAIVAAVILGACTLITPIVTLRVKSYVEDRKYFRPPKDRRAALRGTWRGKLLQQDGPDNQPLEHDLIMRLEVKGRKIEGTAEVSSKLSTEALNLDGGFYDASYFKVDYENQNASKVQFGIFVLRVSANANVMKGKCLGFGHITEKLAEADIDLVKIS